MERVVHVAKNYEDADKYDRRQSLELSASERIFLARKLRVRVFGNKNPDIREWHRKKSV